MVCGLRNFRPPPADGGSKPKKNFFKVHRMPPNRAKFHECTIKLSRFQLGQKKNTLFRTFTTVLKNIFEVTENVLKPIPKKEKKKHIVPYFFHFFVLEPCNKSSCLGARSREIRNTKKSKEYGKDVLFC